MDLEGLFFWVLFYNITKLTSASAKHDIINDKWRLILQIVRGMVMKLVISGNGFDLHHKFKTSYADYRDFLLKQEPQSFKDFEEFVFFSLSDSNKWSDLESSLTIDCEKFVRNSTNNDGDLTWCDLDIDIQQQTKFIYDFTGKFFLEWLSQIDYSLAQNKLNNIDYKDLFVTFNYTDTLRTVYNIPSENIYHIHGAIDDIKTENIQSWFIPNFNTIEEAEIIEQFQADEFNSAIVREQIQFGSIHNNPELIEKQLTTSFEHDNFYSASIEPAIKRVVDFCEAGAKNIEKNYVPLDKFIRNKQIEEVVIMGHSMLGIDKAYYSDIIVPLLNNCRWSFYYHSEDDLIDAKGFVRMFDIKRYEFLEW